CRGNPVGACYGYNAIGVLQNETELENYPHVANAQPGDLIFEDVNGDGVISPEDRTVIGQPTPSVILGVNAGVQAYGFDFSIEFNGQFGYEVANAKRSSRFGLYNFESVFLDRWHGEGTSNTEPRLTTAGINYDNFSSRFLESGNFLRLRNVQLGYSLPESVLERLRLTRLRVYVSGTNLMTWQDYSGYMPELYNNNVFDVGIDAGKYPLAKSVLFGLDLSF
ncbi:MAG: SusC/RagA family protein, partial [Lewinella sp.]|nr:SusC/RagA family protein [Lewinella sp.]